MSTELTTPTAELCAEDIALLAKALDTPRRKYQWVQNEDGSILVLDVEVMGVVAPGERADPADSVSREELPEFLAKTHEIEAKLGRQMLYQLNHNDFKTGKPGKVLGRVIDKYVDGDWIRGNILVTNPSAVAAMKRGELPTRSPEYARRGPHRGYMWALACPDALPGHFDDRLPELTLEKSPLTYAMDAGILSAEDQLATCALEGAAALKLEPEANMPLTKEDLEAIGGVVDARVDAKLKAVVDPLNKKVEDMARLSAAGKSDGVTDLDAVQNQAKSLVQNELTALEQQKAKNNLELERSKAMATLSAETTLSKAAINKYLENVGIEAIPFRVNELKARFGKNRDAKIGDEDNAAHGDMAALAKEFEAGGGEKVFHMTQNEYCLAFAGKITEGLEA